MRCTLVEVTSCRSFVYVVEKKGVTRLLRSQLLVHSSPFQISKASENGLTTAQSQGQCGCSSLVVN